MLDSFFYACNAQLRRTVAICVWVHDQHEAVLHLRSEANADPRVRRASKVEVHITRVVRDIDRELRCRFRYVESRSCRNEGAVVLRLRKCED